MASMEMASMGAEDDSAGQVVYDRLKMCFADFLKGGINFFEELAAEKLRMMIFEEFPNADSRKKVS